ncbi:MAG: glucosylglycerol hydrolase, partial [Cyanobacteria bacterium P01_D01_bin.56]
MIATAQKQIQLVEDETQSLLIWAENIQRSEATFFEKAQKIARRLGAHYRADRLTEVGFWTPDLTGDIIQSEDRIVLEIFTPTADIDFRLAEQTVTFKRSQIPLVKQGEFVWGVIEGMRPGRRDRSGCFYWLRYIDQDGRIHIIRDPLAYSLPYGIFAPAELYDMRLVQRQRADRGYFQRTGSSYSDTDLLRIAPPTNILQVHVKTASPQGTLEGLTEIYQRISDKLAAGEELTPSEAVYAGYDAIQLLPVV